MLDFFESVILFQPECLPIELSHISSTLEVLLQGEEILLQGLKLIISASLVVGQNGDAVRHLEAVRVSCVIHQHQLRQVPTQQPQVLYVVSLIHVVAVPPEEPVLHVLAVWVQMVNHFIRV